MKTPAKSSTPGYAGGRHHHHPGRLLPASRFFTITWPWVAMPWTHTAFSAISTPNIVPCAMMDAPPVDNGSRSHHRCQGLRLGVGSVRIGSDRVLETSIVHRSEGHPTPQRILCQAKKLYCHMKFQPIERTERAGITNFLTREGGTICFAGISCLLPTTAHTLRCPRGDTYAQVMNRALACYFGARITPD